MRDGGGKRRSIPPRLRQRRAQLGRKMPTGWLWRSPLQGARGRERGASAALEGWRILPTSRAILGERRYPRLLRGRQALRGGQAARASRGGSRAGRGPARLSRTRGDRGGEA